MSKKRILGSLWALAQIFISALVINIVFPSLSSDAAVLYAAIGLVANIAGNLNEGAK